MEWLHGIAPFRNCYAALRSYGAQQVGSLPLRRPAAPALRCRTLAKNAVDPRDDPRLLARPSWRRHPEKHPANLPLDRIADRRDHSYRTAERWRAEGILADWERGRDRPSRAETAG